MFRFFKSNAALLGITLAISSAAQAEIDRGLATCAVIRSSVERLACYDGLAQKRDVAAPKVTVTTKGKWQVRSKTSKIDDTTNVYVSLESENSFQTPLNGEQRATIQITCREKSTDFYVYMGGMFLADSSEFGSVIYRIDKNKADWMNMSESTNHEALGLWQGSGIRFVKKLTTGQNLLLKITPFNQSPITVEFKIAGLAEAIKPLRQACGW